MADINGFIEKSNIRRIETEVFEEYYPTIAKVLSKNPT